MPGLNRSAQLGNKVEATEGVEETLTGTEFGGNRKETKSTNKIDRYDRDLERVSLTPLDPLPGSRQGGHSWTAELVGGGIATAAPWHPDVQGMGFIKTQHKAFATGVITNAASFRVGNIIGDNATQGSATKTGIFVCFANGKIVYVPVTGTFANTDTMYEYDSVSQGSTTLTGAIANAGYRLSVLTETDSSKPASLTVERRVNGQRHTAIGSRGRGSITIKRNEPILIQAEYLGAPVLDLTDPLNPKPRSGSVVTGVPDFLVKPKVAKGITLNIYQGSTSYAPVLTEAVFKIENTLAPRPSIGTSLAESGYLATRITQRRISMQIDPENVPVSFDFGGCFFGGTPFELEGRIGDPTDANGLVIVHAPRGVLQGDLDFGDRDGVQTVPVDALLCGSNDDEFYLYHVFA